MTKVAVIGSGFVGRGWAISFARAGSDVALWDQDAAAPGRAHDYIADILGALETHDLLNGQTPAEVLARIQGVERLEDALAGADHAQESVYEDVELKREIFARLDAAAAPETVLASSTSAILPSRFTEALAGRHRCVVVHPINPPYLVPAAEVVPAPWTAPETVERAASLLRAAGHAPIVMKREIDGFVMNRMQAALLEEAFRLVADGYASVEDVDIGLRDGLALRWSFMGPFETIDLNAPGGVRDYVGRYNGLFQTLFEQMQRRADWTGPPLDRIEAERRERLPADGLEARQVWRDRHLIALAAHKKRAAKEIGE